MSILGSNMLAGAAGRARHEIERSLRFNRSESTELNFTPSSAGNQKTWTWSAWIKRSLLNTSGNFQHLFNPLRGGDGSNEAVFRFRDDNTLEIEDSGNTRGQLVTNQVFRDTSAWYHIVFVLDTTQATAANRAKLYVNGEQVTSFSAETYPSQNTTWGWNGAQEHGLGVYNLFDAQYFDGYMAEVNFVDGTALDASYFGETDLETGAWIPRQYNGSYGTNGFYLKFADNSGVTATTLGKDSSGNANNWTPSNFSVTAGAGNDSLLDTPTNNWCTLNSAANTTGTRTLSNGNLQADLSGAGAKGVGTFLIPTSGKWYWEMTANDSNSNQAPGVLQHNSDFGTYDTSKAASYFPNGEYKIESASQVSGFSTYTTNDVIAFAVDADTSPPEIYFAKNNTWQNSADPAAGTNGFDLTANQRYLPYMQHGSSSSSSSGIFNFGQRAFAYTPPAGFQALNAKNLPVLTIPNGAKYFKTVLYTGNGSTQTISGVGFQPDWTWIKQRNAAENHFLTDVVRGAGIHLRTDQTGAENDDSATFTAFTSDGFSLTGTGPAEPQVNDNSDTYVSWNWKAGGTASNNFDGNTTALVSANPEAGLSIVAYTGTGSETTVGHGLGVTPDMIWVKNRDASEHWIIDSRLITGNANGTLHFNTDAEYTGGTNQFGTHSSSIFTVKTSGNINTSGQKYVAYVFSEVEGYSKFGSYLGNGSVDGTFIYTGFKPRWIMFKSSSSSESGNANWAIVDTLRSPTNFALQRVWADLSNAEDNNVAYKLDILSNGFKFRNGDSGYGHNTSGNTYIFMAFAETPFKYANAR